MNYILSNIYPENSISESLSFIVHFLFIQKNVKIHTFHFKFKEEEEPEADKENEDAFEQKSQSPAADKKHPLEAKDMNIVQTDSNTKVQANFKIK